MVRGRKASGREGALLIHRYAVPLSRCGSGTLGLFHSTGVKFSPLVPLRYPQEKAKGAETEGGRKRGRAGRRGHRPLRVGRESRGC